MATLAGVFTGVEFSVGYECRKLVSINILQCAFHCCQPEFGGWICADYLSRLSRGRGKNTSAGKELSDVGFDELGRTFRELARLRRR